MRVALVNPRKKIALIGSGEMGSRLLQGLLSVGSAAQAEAFDIVVVDPNPQSLAVARRRADDIFAAARPEVVAHRVAYRASIAGIDADLDLAILACTSRHRHGALRDLLAAATPRAILLEKFLFDRAEHYADAGTWLADRGIPAWVHTPRGYWPAYARIRGILAEQRPDAITVTGTNFSLASNCVHFFDLERYLSGSSVDRVECAPGLAAADNKRVGYREVFGTLTGWVAGRQAIVVTCDAGAAPRVVVDVSGNGQRMVYEETSALLTIFDAAGSIVAEETHRAVMASANTAIFADLLAGQAPRLPTYVEAATTHLAVIDALKGTLADASGALPVT